jgi:predicted ATPase
MKRAAIYARVSTRNGHQDPATQLLALRQVAERGGWQIVGEYVDHGISGAKGHAPGWGASGAPPTGIGKSRLAREMREPLAHEPHIRLLYQCSPHHTTSPLHAVIEQLERAAGFGRDDPPEARLDRLEALLVRGTGRLDQAVPLIAALLGVPAGERYPLPEQTPQRQLEALVEQLEGLAAEQPVLLADEDVHWIDPTTQELLELAIERVQRLAVLLLITFRPEFTPPWSGQPHVSALALTRLGRRDGAALVERAVGEKSLPEEIAAQIVARTDGVPLFVEELTKAVLESGLLKDTGDRYELTGPLPPLAIPSTLHARIAQALQRDLPEVAEGQPELLAHHCGEAGLTGRRGW